MADYFRSLNGYLVKDQEAREQIINETKAREEAIRKETSDREKAITAEAEARQQAIAAEAEARQQALQNNSQNWQNAVQEEGQARQQGDAAEAQARTEAMQNLKTDLERKIETEKEDRIDGELRNREYINGGLLDLHDTLVEKIEGVKTNLYPSLTDDEKAEIKNLMDTYKANNTLFKYAGNVRRESYLYPNDLQGNLAGDYFIEGSMSEGKHLLNCGLFAQFIWMGRAISDFDTNGTPTGAGITRAFNWGYYFDFRLAQISQDYILSDGTYSPYNSYTGLDGNKHFVCFDGVASMAEELYRGGYEVPYSEVEVGDLVFYRTTYMNNDEDDMTEANAFRHIDHCGVVYDVDDYGPIVIESTNAWSGSLGFVGLSDNSKLNSLSRLRACGLSRKVVMCARHPKAFGKGGNVPEALSKYRGILTPYLNGGA